MKPVFDPAAAEEIEEAAGWYEAHKSGLGRDFVVEVNASIRRIIEFPNAWPPVSREFAVYNLPGFPTPSFIKCAAMRFSSSPSRTCIVGPSTGAID